MQGLIDSTYIANGELADKPFYLKIYLPFLFPIPVLLYAPNFGVKVT